MPFPSSPGQQLALDSPLPGFPRAACKAALIGALRRRNHFSRQGVRGSARAVVSMTSYGKRLDIVAHALESLAAGSVRPARLILWVDEPAFDVSRYPMLQRLERRGLEILHCEDLGPYKKYYPYCSAYSRDNLPLVLADDDLLYPRRWLEVLLRAYNSSGPDEIPAYRAHRMHTLPDGTLGAYNNWRPAPVGSSSHANFLTGGAGVILPPRMQEAVRQAGTAFRELAPRADDIWLNALAIRSGLQRRVINAEGQHLTLYPRSQGDALHNHNVGQGHNDVQLAAVFGPAEIAAVAAEMAGRP